MAGVKAASKVDLPVPWPPVIWPCQALASRDIDKLLEALALLEDEVDRARPQPRGTERIASDRGWEAGQA